MDDDEVRRGQHPLRRGQGRHTGGPAPVEQGRTGAPHAPLCGHDHAHHRPGARHPSPGREHHAGDHGLDHGHLFHAEGLRRARRGHGQAHRGGRLAGPRRGHGPRRDALRPHADGKARPLAGGRYRGRAGHGQCRQRGGLSSPPRGGEGGGRFRRFRRHLQRKRPAHGGAAPPLRRPQNAGGTAGRRLCPHRQ